jgi:hypothetical protein
MNNYKSLVKKSNELEEFLYLENSDVSEAWEMLTNLARRHHCFTEEFNLAIEREIDDSLKRIETECKIVITPEQTVTRIIAARKELIWLEDD